MYPVHYCIDTLQFPKPKSEHLIKPASKLLFHCVEMFKLKVFTEEKISVAYFERMSLKNLYRNQNLLRSQTNCSKHLNIYLIDNAINNKKIT